MNSIGSQVQGYRLQAIGYRLQAVGGVKHTHTHTHTLKPKPLQSKSLFN